MSAPKKPPPSLFAIKLARAVISLVTDYNGVKPAWLALGQRDHLRITRLAARRVEKLLAERK